MRSRCTAFLSLLAAITIASGSIVADAKEGARKANALDLATLSDISALAVSPDGQWAAFQIRKADPRANAYTQEWQIISTQGGTPKFIAGAGEPILLSSGFILGPPLVWSPDSQWIAYLRKENGRTQIWRARVDGQRSEQLTYGESDVRALTYAPDGQRVLYETEPSKAQTDAMQFEEGLSGFLYDSRFHPGRSQRPIYPPGISFVSGNSTEAEKAIRRYFVYDVMRATSHDADEAEAAEFAMLTSVSKPEERPHYRANVAGALVARSPHGALAWTEARDPERQGAYAPVTIVAKPIGAEAAIVCSAPECVAQMKGGLWWRNENEIVFLRRKDNLSQRELYTWRVGQGSPRLIMRTHNLFNSPPEWTCSIAQDRLICLYEESTRPRRLVAIDLDSGAVETLHDPNSEFASLDLGSPPKRLEFRSASGVQTYGYLVVPRHHHRGERLSLIIVTYRCYDFLRGGTGDEYPVFPFVSNGHAVLCFNNPDTDYKRLETMSGAEHRAWARQKGDPLRRRVQAGLEAALLEVSRMDIVDPDRIGITGYSGGAETVMYALFKTPRFAAAISSGPEFAPSCSFLCGPAGYEVLRTWGLESPTSKRWKSVSITRNAERVRTPLLINGSDQELTGTAEIFAPLKGANRAIEMYVFPDEYHTKWQPAHRLAIYNRNIDWMNFWLRGVEDSDSAKVEQYKRWRAMRVKQCELFKGDDAPWYCEAEQESAH